VSEITVQRDLPQLGCVVLLRSQEESWAEAAIPIVGYSLASVARESCCREVASRRIERGSAVQVVPVVRPKCWHLNNVTGRSADFLAICIVMDKHS
jgi:hypothetical protein